MIWSADRDQVALTGRDLPDPGPELIYQLWFLLPDGVAPAGLFRPDDGEVSTVIDVDDIAGAGWGVTIEPAAGSEQPTGEVLFVGTI